MGSQMQKLDKAKCSICQSRMQLKGKEELRILACGHGFHKSCVARWLDISAGCPECRAKVEIPGKWLVKSFSPSPDPSSEEEKEELRSKRGASSCFFGKNFSPTHKKVSVLSLSHSEEKDSSKKTASRRRRFSQKPEADKEDRASSVVESSSSSSSSSTSPRTVGEEQEEVVPSFDVSLRNEKKKGLKRNAFPQKKRDF